MLKARIKSVNWNNIYFEIDGEIANSFPIKAKGKEFEFWWGLVAPPRITFKRAPKFQSKRKFERWVENHLPKKRLERFLTGTLGQKVIIVNS